MVNLRNYVDLSHKLSGGISVYPGDSPYSCKPTLTIGEDGSGCNVSVLTLSSHSGTHIDAPFHFDQHGKTIDQLPISMLIGSALVVDLTSKAERDLITWDDLAQYAPSMKEGVILVLYTGWSKHWGTEAYFDHPFLDRSAAEGIIRTGVRVIGCDMFSPDETRRDGTWSDFAAHKVILGAGGVIAENLTNTGSLEDGMTISLVPMNISGGDGSSVRAFAWKE